MRRRRELIIRICEAIGRGTIAGPVSRVVLSAIECALREWIAVTCMMYIVGIRRKVAAKQRDVSRKRAKWMAYIPSDTPRDTGSRNFVVIIRIVDFDGRASPGV